MGFRVLMPPSGWVNHPRGRERRRGLGPIQRRLGRTAPLGFCAAFPDQLNMTGLSLPKPRPGLEDDVESEESDDYY